MLHETLPRGIMTKKSNECTTCAPTQFIIPNWHQDNYVDSKGNFPAAVRKYQMILTIEGIHSVW